MSSQGGGQNEILGQTKSRLGILVPMAGSTEAAFLRTTVAHRYVMRRPRGKHSNSNQKQKPGVDGTTVCPLILPSYPLCMK